MALIGTVTGIAGLIGQRKARKDMNKLLKNAPKYKINDEVFENQAISKAEAYGKDRDIEMAQENIDADVASATGEVKDITTSTSALLNALTEIQNAAFDSKRGLSEYEAGTLRRQKIGALKDANQAVVDEKDKAWNYNENMPYQMRVAAARDKRKFNEELMMKGVDSATSEMNAVHGALGQMFGSMGGMMSDERVKGNIEPTHYDGLEQIKNLEVVDFNYSHGILDDTEKKHVGLIAQNTQKVIPEAVRMTGFNVPDSEEKLLLIDYNEITPLLIKAVQQLSKRVEELEAKQLIEA